MSAKKIAFSLFVLCIIFYSFPVFSQATIKGNVKDAKTSETIVGANVILQGTTLGTSTDLDGNFEIKNIKPGIYNLIVSFISYKTKTIDRIRVEAGKTLDLNITIEENVASLEGVTIVAAKRTDTEISMLSTIRQGSLVASGVSSQLIKRSQDRDAADVVKRIAGITLMDDRFVMVRGLSQRYNNVWLNRAATPSSETDVRAFSFDVIPSALLDNILVYKSPAPELPADFSGAAIMVTTRTLSDEDGLQIGFSSSYRSSTTFKNFKNYHPGNRVWLGSDAGVLSLPPGFPAHLNQIKDPEQLTRIGRSLNNIWSPTPGSALPDPRFNLSLSKRFALRKVSLGNITAINYTNTYNRDDIFRADFQVYNEVKDHPDTNNYFYDNKYENKIRIGALHNWQLIFGNNQRIEFRNLFNHFGTFSYIDRNGKDFYGGQTIYGRSLLFQSRNTYSGAIGGQFNFNNQRTLLDFTLGYSYADRDQPDTKRLNLVKSEDDPSSPHYGQYGVNFSFAATPELSGRVYQKTSENVWVGGSNFTRRFVVGNYQPELKAGVYAERKRRQFSARNIGYVIANMFLFDWNLPYQPIDSIFSPQNINNTQGIKLDETTNASDSYHAGNDLLAFYLSLKTPVFTDKLTFSGGARLEKNRQTLDSYSSDNASKPVNYTNDETRLFPSANLSYNLTSKALLRTTYGLTINRPEFREIAPFAYYDFELKRVIRGNDSLRNSLTHNLDLRYEYYPSPSESFALGLFYKKFTAPIETIEINSGSGRDYTFQNALGAYSIGAEVDVRSSLASLFPAASILKNFTLVANAALIKSRIDVDTTRFYSRSYQRPMMGQSPYIVNVGLYYQNTEQKLNLSLLYNVTGKRIVVVGLDFPDVYELPRHSLDFTFIKEWGNHWEIKAGVRDLLNQATIYRQFIEFEKQGEGLVKRTQDSYHVFPGTYYSVGLSYKL
ncbi:MAG: TonB-dependent receptor domain-containing protein [Bacteroidales bacterium]